MAYPMNYACIEISIEATNV